MSHTILNTHTITATTLSPLAVRSGVDLMPWEYIIREEGKDQYQLYAFSIAALYRELPEPVAPAVDQVAVATALKSRVSLEELQALYGKSSKGKTEPSKREELWQKACEHNPLAVRQWIYKHKEELRHEIERISTYTLKVDKALFNHYTKNIASVNLESNQTHQLALNAFIRAAGQAYVPGTSIKGAIRTALLYTLKNSDDERDRQYVALLEKENNTDKDEFKNIAISDAAFVGDARLRAGIIARCKDNNGHAVTQFSEYAPQATKFTFSINFNDARHAFVEKPHLTMDIRSLADSVNQYMSHKLDCYQQQLSLFKQLATEEHDTWKVQLIEREIELIAQVAKKVAAAIAENSQTFYLNLGYGGGFWYKSFNETHPNRGAIRKYRDKELHIARTWWHGAPGSHFGFVECVIDGERAGDVEAVSLPESNNAAV